MQQKLHFLILNSGNDSLLSLFTVNFTFQKLRLGVSPRYLVLYKHKESGKPGFQIDVKKKKRKKKGLIHH